MGTNFRNSFPEPKIPFGTAVFGLLYKYSDFYVISDSRCITKIIHFFLLL